MEKRKVILVGGGVIAVHYKEGLENSRTLRPAALVDLNPACPARTAYALPFFTDAVTAARETGADVAILAVPPAARAALAETLAAAGCDIVAEKPLAPSLAELDAMYAAVRAHGRTVCCMYHWKAADEVRFLREHIAELGALREISAVICDDYAAAGHIRADRLGLGGAWIDSGINVLSYYDELFDMTGIRQIEREELLDGSGMPLYACRRFRVGETLASITVDWRTPSRTKTSYLRGSRGVWEVDHTAQTVTCDGKLLYACPVPDRLGAHYRNLFADLLPADDYDRTRRLHEILFEGESL